MGSSDPNQNDAGVAVRLALLSLGLVSLTLVSGVDDGVYAFAQTHASGIAWLGRYRVASFAVCLALYLASRPGRTYRLPAATTPWRAVTLIAAFWFVPALIMVFVIRVPLPALHSSPDFTAFLLTGLLAEELLFRGALYQLAERATPPTLVKVGVVLPLWPIALSALLFSLAHLQYYDFAITGPALAQLSYTLIMGLFWGALRPLTASIWPAIGFHLVTNVIAVSRILLSA